jgi:hypothetical protein
VARQRDAASVRSGEAMKKFGTPMRLSEVRLVAKEHAKKMDPYHHMCLTWLLAYVDELKNVAKFDESELVAIEERLFRKNAGGFR